MLNVKMILGTVMGTLLAISPVKASAQAVELIPYQAGYVVSLSSNSDRSMVSAVTGKVAFGFEKICGGWLFQQRGNMSNHLPDGNVVPQIFQFSSIEKSGEYQFSIKTGGTSKDVILGRAEMGGVGESGQVVFSRPEKMTLSLPPNTLFPAAHTRSMIEAAQAGKRQFERLIFEGTDTNSAKLLVAFVSPMSDAGKAVIAKMGGKLKSQKGWHFQMAYFDPTDQSGTPVYEVGVDQLDNGIALRWELDYGSHAVEMKMVKVQSLVEPDCSAQK
ncbi:MAG: DUF1849 family protein [Magnetovibrio sp.]|nr:DUF1849 family protein [Magnetovibrio sp.]